MGTPCCGGKSEILRRYLKEGTEDPVYPDPPHSILLKNNTFFQEKDGTDATGQIRASQDNR